MRYYICMFNNKARITFVIEEHGACYEGVISIRSQYCPVRINNKDKTTMYIVDYLILDDAKYYFIYHIDI